MARWFNRGLATVTVFVVSFFLMFNFLGTEQKLDPLVRLEQAALVAPPWQIGMPTTPPSALPITQKRLALAASRMGATITYGPLGPGWYGHTEMVSRAVTINETLNSDLRTTTLAHELAHMLQPYGLDHGDEEVWADSVAYLVLAGERDNLVPAAHYIGAFKTHLNVLQVYRREMLFAATFLRGEVE